MVVNSTECNKVKFRRVITAMESMPTKRPLTSDEKFAQTRLRVAWDAWSKLEKGRTQQSIADQLGITQTSLGHYLNGRNPLNVEFLLRICSIIETNPVDIYPQLFTGIDFSIVQYGHGKELDELIQLLKKFPIEKLQAIKTIL